MNRSLPSISRAQCRYPIHFTGSSPHPSDSTPFSTPSAPASNRKIRSSDTRGARRGDVGKRGRKTKKVARRKRENSYSNVPSPDDTRISARGLPEGEGRGLRRETSKQKETGNPPGCLASIFNAAKSLRLFSRPTIEVTPAESRIGDDAPTSTVFALDRRLRD